MRKSKTYALRFRARAKTRENADTFANESLFEYNLDIARYNKIVLLFFLSLSLPLNCVLSSVFRSFVFSLANGLGPDKRKKKR